jgi:rhodanese-related sulfurtransferase
MHQDKVISGEELLDILESKSENFLLIDVREEWELQHGMIPQAQSLPLNAFPTAILLDEESFEEQFRFPKPSKGTMIILYCKTGGRSAMAQQFLEDNGYTNVINYEGSIREFRSYDENINYY